jgi:hypothetical protein
MGRWLLLLDGNHEDLGLLEDRRASDMSKGAAGNELSVVLRGVAAADCCKGAGGDLAFGDVEVGGSGRVGQLQYSQHRGSSRRLQKLYLDIEGKGKVNVALLA